MKITKKLLYELYVTQGLSSYKIAKELNLSSRYIRYKLKEFCINRDQKEAAALRHGQDNREHYSPIHSSINWQIPTKRRETYAWCRHYAQTNTDLSNIISRLTCPYNFEFGIEPDLSAHAEDILVRINDMMPSIAYHYFVFGDCFLLASRDSNGNLIDIQLINPDLIDIQINPIKRDEFQATFLPDIREEVLNNEDLRIPDFIKESVRTKTPIALNPKDIFRISRMKETCMMIYGRSFISQYFHHLVRLDMLTEEKGFSDEAMEEYMNIRDQIIIDDKVIDAEVGHFKSEAYNIIHSIINQEFPEDKENYYFD